jgi:hypothetical protein
MLSVAPLNQCRRCVGKVRKENERPIVIVVYMLVQVVPCSVSDGDAGSVLEPEHIGG